MRKIKNRAWDIDKQNVYLTLMPKNKVTEDVVSGEFLDLMAVPRVGMGHGSVMVKKEDLANYGVTEEEVVMQALNNLELMTMITPLLNRMVEVGTITEEDKEQIEGPEMFIISNGLYEYGAAQMMQMDVLQEVADLAEGDLYILPSSVHELIALKTEDMNLDYLKETVKEINENIVKSKDYLSDNVYMFTRDLKTLRIV